MFFSYKILKNQIVNSYGIMIFVKKIFLINYNHIFFINRFKGNLKSKKIIIASNTISSIKTTNIELFFAKIFSLRNYPITFYSSNGEHCRSLVQRKEEKYLILIWMKYKRLKICHVNYFHMFYIFYFYLIGSILDCGQN